MYNEFYKKQAQLLQDNEAFVTATVVHREVPSSGKSGDKAVVDQHGSLTGWIGGGCVKGIVLKEAEEALRSGQARLVKVGGDQLTKHVNGIKEYKMTCMSEGIVDIFIEPVLPAPHMIIIGKTSIAKALVKLSSAMGYRLSLIAPDAEKEYFPAVNEFSSDFSMADIKSSFSSALVICTQGENDEEAIEAALKTECFYKGFIASEKKKGKVFENLISLGADASKIAKIHSPAGINIDAKKPEEVAVSILAEIIQKKNNLEITGFSHFESKNKEEAESPLYINPVCGVLVDKKNPKHVVEFAGEKVYFCCDGCKVKFDKEPEKHFYSEGFEGM